MDSSVIHHTFDGQTLDWDNFLQRSISREESSDHIDENTDGDLVDSSDDVLCVQLILDRKFE